MSFCKPPIRFSGTPLSAISAVVIDTETTGLHVQKDRIIEMGGIAIRGGKEDPDNTYQQFVNPGIPVPPASTDIHGLVDADLHGSPDFAGTIESFTNWVGESLVLGYSLGFDLGVLKAEHQRHRIPWSAPRWLDVQHLLAIVSPNLPNQSLETVAAWANIDLTDRHRALADARITAKLFIALIPMLRDRGIVTLAQAERASALLADRLQLAQGEGWEEQHWIRKGDPARQLALIDSFPYRHRVAHVMNDTPVILPGSTLTSEALQTMISRKISSVFFQPDRSDQDARLGVCTERDILRALNAQGDKGFHLPIEGIGSEPLLCVDQDAFIYRAMGLMTAHQLRHLGVTDAQGRLTGVITSRDLLQQRSGDTVNLGQSIQLAKTAQELGNIWTALTPVTQSLVYEEVDVRTIASLISTELCTLTARTCELALEKMQRLGRGSPPCPFALMVLGSGGRGESLLAMDQDNAIVYQHPTDPELDKWFIELGSHFTEMLDSAGVPYCKGGVMASNPLWCKSLDGWKQTVKEWVRHASGEDLLQCDIFFDGTSVHGDSTLVTQLLDYARKLVSQSPLFLQALTIKCSNFSSSIGTFGRFKLHNDRVDCKLNGIMPIFSTARLLALRHRLSASSTPARLEQAIQHDSHHHSSVGNLKEAHKILLQQILSQQLRDLARGISLSNRVNPVELLAWEKRQLRWGLQQIMQVRDLLEVPAFYINK